MPALFVECRPQPTYTHAQHFRFPIAGESYMSKRYIIVHFHFFKNAGTSVESILRKNLKRRFMSYEHGGPAETFPGSVLVPILEEKQKIAAISSHTISFPPPEHEDWTVFPIVFIRHPLDRLLSMYNFEKKQKTDSPGALLARGHGLTAYIEARLDNPHQRTLRDYQTWMLGQNRAKWNDLDGQFRVAVDTIEGLPVVGVVDRFSESVKKFTDWLAPYFPGLHMKAVHKHQSGLSKWTMDDRIRHLRNEVGDELFKRISDANARDLELYRIANERLGEPV